MLVHRGLVIVLTLGCSFSVGADTLKQAPAAEDARLHTIVEAVDAARLHDDVARLVSFGTRHTLSETGSETRGIGAARRFVEAEMQRISVACGGCLEVRVIGETWQGERRIPDATEVVNVLAIQRGSLDPDRYVLMAGDIDSRASDVMDAEIDAPGANDNATGIAGVLEAARVLSKYRFAGSIVYAALSGEEQGLFGGKTVARVATDEGWRVEAVLNNDMIGNIEGIDGVIDNTTVRVFSEGVPPNETDEERRRRRFTGGEVDGPSRQLARYIARLAGQYLRTLDVMMVYRLDRFGRGGHQTPFADVGFPAVRVMEAHEHYDRQHQDLRTENGIAYGDVIDAVNFEYLAKVTALNAATLASLAWAPPPPTAVEIGGAVQPAARLTWRAPDHAQNLAGYRVHWRLTDQPQWTNSRFVGAATEHTTHGLVIDNYFFGVSTVSANGHESRIVFPRRAPRRPR